MTITGNVLIRYEAFQILALFHYSFYDTNICKISFDMYFHTDTRNNNDNNVCDTNNKCIMRFSFRFLSELSLNRN